MQITLLFNKKCRYTNIIEIKGYIWELQSIDQVSQYYNEIMNILHASLHKVHGESQNYSKNTHVSSLTFANKQICASLDQYDVNLSTVGLILIEIVN